QRIHQGEGVGHNRHRSFEVITHRLQVEQTAADVLKPLVDGGGSGTEVFAQQGFQRGDGDLDLALGQRGPGGTLGHLAGLPGREIREGQRV
ncbi:hypothetical protein RBE51_22835, partial [Pseudomonas taiwanensis]|uniref:hypothetical protein n=2 Tax=Pseudomonas TaxID=286 RepID=UPI0028E09BC9